MLDDAPNQRRSVVVEKDYSECSCREIEAREIHKYEIIAARNHWRLLLCTSVLIVPTAQCRWVLGVLTLVSLGMLLAWNVNPKFFPIRAHGFLAAFPLAMIAITYLLYQSARPRRSVLSPGKKHLTRTRLPTRSFGQLAA